VAIPHAVGALARTQRLADRRAALRGRCSYCRTLGATGSNQTLIPGCNPVVGSIGSAGTREVLKSRSPTTRAARQSQIRHAE
jgi:hypothetical protein